MYAFTYHSPDNLRKAVSLLEAAEDAKLLAGGQTLLPTMKQRLASPANLVDLNKIPGMAEISSDAEGVVIGAMARHADVATSSVVAGAIPALAELAAGIGDPAVRHRGTIGGSIANNDPAADYPSACLALGATIEDTRYEDFEWLMNINFWGVVHGTKAFLPHVKRSGDGHIVNISSVFGLVGVPTQAAYNAAKFAVKGFTEALRQELEIEGAPVGVTTVHPGGIKTNIAKNARRTDRDGWVDEKAVLEFEKLFRTTPESAAEDIVAAILGNRRRQLIGADAVMIDLMQRAFPTLYQALVVAGARRRGFGITKKAAGGGER